MDKRKFTNPIEINKGRWMTTVYTSTGTDCEIYTNNGKEKAGILGALAIDRTLELTGRENNDTERDC